MPEILVFTKTGCPHCSKLLEDYKRDGVVFTECNTSLDPEAKKLAKEKYGAKKVPLVVKEDKVVSEGYQGGG